MRAPIRVGLVTLVLLGLRSAAAEAQHAEQTVVRVRVVDTTGAGVTNVDVAVLRGLNTVAARGTTDETGQRTVAIPRDGEYQIVVRRIGFQRTDQFFHADRDSIALRMVLHRSTQQLPTVSVTAEQDLRRKHYHVDADEIAASTRPIIDGLDILTKLRPDIIYPRVPPRSLDACGLFYVWVNGTRIVFAPVNEALAIRAAQERRAARATPHIGITGLAAVPVNVQSVLSSIHPEHIDEINYADCNDFSVEKTQARNAVFVTLKPGIGFEPGRGSFVADEPVRADLSAQAASGPAQPSPSALAAFRTRILGVFDESTGEPIPDAEVADSASGTFARTTVTGTVSLVFLPEGMSTVLVHKAGYADVRIDVSISPRDSIPITLTMAKPKLR